MTMPSLNLLIGSSGRSRPLATVKTFRTTSKRFGGSHTEFSPRVSQTVLDAAEAVEADHQAMVSGAGHDATYLNEITDAAMIFVPSVDGKTHNEAEYTEWEDAVAGARTFAEATRQLASRPDDA